MQTKGIDKDKMYRFETAIQAEKQLGGKKRKRNKESKEAYGWEVFNTDSLYRAYEKRVNKMMPHLKAADTSAEAPLSMEQRVDLMAQETEQRIEKRN